MPSVFAPLKRRPVMAANRIKREDYEAFKKIMCNEFA
jgi:hypothetical protein